MFRPYVLEWAMEGRAFCPAVSDGVRNVCRLLYGNRAPTPQVVRCDLIIIKPIMMMMIMNHFRMRDTL